VRYIVGAAAVAAALTAAGCGEGGKDAGVQDRAYGDRPVINMPDQFPNISEVCVKGHLIVESTRTGGQGGWVVTFPDDPSCRGRDGVPPLEMGR
jgi:hypothetical protein